MAKSSYSVPVWHERRKQVISLREAHKMTFSEIGRAMGITQQRAWSLYQFAAAERDERRAIARARRSAAAVERPW